MVQEMYFPFLSPKELMENIICSHCKWEFPILFGAKPYEDKIHRGIVIPKQWMILFFYEFDESGFASLL